MAYILADAWLITMNERREVLDQASLLIEGERIAAIRTADQLRRASASARTAEPRCSDGPSPPEETRQGGVRPARSSLRALCANSCGIESSPLRFITAIVVSMAGRPCA
jgi:hypothetical protein